jgi:inner membrane transporter RhtA
MLNIKELPPHFFFFVSAVFHYLGPSFAVLLFANVNELGVAWLRIASAAAAFSLWRRPWRVFGKQNWNQRLTLIGLGVVLGLMNMCFYLAIARLPLGTVGAIEFVGPIVLAALGVRNLRNGLAVILALAGGYLLSNVYIEAEPLGLFFAVLNCGLFMFYIILGHRIARDGGTAGVDRLGVAMLIALLTTTPFAFTGALPALLSPTLLLAGIAVGICSSVIPYICDQLAMARLPRATFALLLALLPAFAVLIGTVVLQQIPSLTDLIGVGLIIVGVVAHQPHQ